MHCLPTFHLCDDRGKLERDIAEMKAELSRLREEIKHYYYGNVIKSAGWVEDKDISTSSVFESAYREALPVFEARLSDISESGYRETLLSREKRKQRVYDGLITLTYREEDKLGGVYTYVADMEEPVTIYKMVHAVGRDDDSNALCHIKRHEHTDLTPPHTIEIFSALTECLKRDGSNLTDDEAERYRSDVKDMLRCFVPHKYYLPRECDIENNGRRGPASGKDIFIDALKRLRMEEWEEFYRGEDGTWTNPDGAVCQNHCPTWSLILEYRDGKEPLNFGGENDCPFNLSVLTRLLEGLEESNYFRDYGPFCNLVRDEKGRREDEPKGGGAKEETSRSEPSEEEKPPVKDAPDEPDESCVPEESGLVFSGMKRYYKEDLTKRDQHLENATPYKIEIEGRVIDDGAWGPMLLKVVNLLLELHPKSEEDLLGFSPDWTKQEIFTDHDKVNHKKVREGLYLNTNHTAVHSCWVLQDILDLFGVDKSNVSFLIHRPSGAESKVVRELLERRFKKGFKEYLTGKAGKTEEYADKVISNIDKVLNPRLASMSKSYDNFFLFDDLQTLDNYIGNVRSQLKKTLPMNSPAIDTYNTCLDLLRAFYASERKKYKDAQKGGGKK